MYVDYEQTEVDKFWSDVQGIIHMVNSDMLSFLNLFCVE